MGDAHADFRSRAARLQVRARLDLVVRRAVTGVFYGLLPGLAAAVLAGTLALPFRALTLALCAAAAGLAAGTASALIARIDRRNLLIRADAVLGSREVISTAEELEGRPAGLFAEAIVEDAAALLSRTAPRVILGRLRIRLAPYAALAAALTAAALVFPVDLKSVLPRPDSRQRELAQIGEDLRKKGERLAEDARARELGRSLALSQQLAQLGRDLVDRKVTPDEALDRMSQLESGLSREYQLRQQLAQPDASGIPAPGEQGNGEPGAEGKPGQKGRAGQPGSSESEKNGTALDDPSMKDLGDALDRLRRAQRDLRRGGGSDTAQAPDKDQPRGPSGAPGQGLPPGSGQAGQQGQDQGKGGKGQGSGTDEQPGEPGSSGVGTQPAPEKRGPASPIIGGNRGPALAAQGNPGEGDSTRMLARSLPEWTGSQLPEDTILNRYSRQAETALQRDEIPLELRQSVKEYFTSIGITK